MKNIDLFSQIPFASFREIDVTKPALFRVSIDEETARLMLSLNTKNRNIRRAAVDYLKDQIENGEWRPDHPQPIVFSEKGRLIDGQHRLQAIYEICLKSKKSFVARVESGASDDVREYLDTGVPRTLDDRVELVENLAHNKVIAQLCTYGFYKKGKASKRPSPEDAKEFFIEHPESSLFIAKAIRREKGIGRIQVAYAAMEYYELDRKKAELFYPALFTIDSDVQQARMLRDWLLRYASSTGIKENRASTRDEIYLRAISCMKAHKAGREITLVRKATW
jgi:hypothetical protein